MKLLSWNVNGIRARHNNGFLQQVFDEQPDILCLQEVKASMENIPEPLKNLDDYHLFLNHYHDPAYAGVALFTRSKPQEVLNGFSSFLETGRVLQAQYDDFKIYNIYFPTGTGSAEKLENKFNFFNRFLKTMEKESSENIIICGDFNIAHHEIDLPNPHIACKSPGFLPEERAFLDKLLELGFVDSFREFNGQPHNYTWWSYGHKCRENNIGMRLDYFFVSQNLKNNIKNANTRKDITGSDHCPIELNISL
jgi:exodeoxyribonuclease-3